MPPPPVGDILLGHEVITIHLSQSHYTHCQDITANHQNMLAVVAKGNQRLLHVFKQAADTGPNFVHWYFFRNISDTFPREKNNYM